LATTLGTGTLNASRQATFTTSSLGAGSHSITAIYGGDGIFTPSTSPALNQVANQVPTTTALASSVNPSNVHQAVIFTSTVTSATVTPTGTVTFKDGATVIGTATLTAGAAAFTTSSLAPGTHTITASYGGSAGFVGSMSPALTQTVQIPADSVRLRALQVSVTKMEAQSSGDAFAGAVDGAIADGFSEGGGTLITASSNGVRLNFAAEPDASLTGGRVVDQYDSVLATRANALRDSGLSAMNQTCLPACAASHLIHRRPQRVWTMRSPRSLMPTQWRPRRHRSCRPRPRSGNYGRTCAAPGGTLIPPPATFAADRSTRSLVSPAS
jgi:hypothetical protein